MTKLKNNNVNYKWISAHFTVDVDKDTSHESFGGVIRMRKDSVIWMTVSVALGAYTALHAKLDGDSVMYIDHYNSMYFKGTYDYLDTLLKEDIDFDLIQSVMVGNSLEFYNDTSKMKAYFDGRDYVLSTVRKRRFRRLMYRNKPLHSKNDAQLIWLDANDFHIKKVRLEDFVTHRTFEATYENFQKGDSGITFPMHIHYEINAEKVIKIDLTYKKVNFTNYEKIPFIIPKKYAQIRY
ncbi:MAG TPA: DUF4292 domain-containing protein [Bacteroidia bacterium]|nr:DUF4292 domain-containing protein [Bacteroidia bacterium]